VGEDETSIRFTGRVFCPSLQAPTAISGRQFPHEKAVGTTVGWLLHDVCQSYCQHTKYYKIVLTFPSPVRLEKLASMVHKSNEDQMREQVQLHAIDSERMSRLGWSLRLLS
jgi:hypothetical protein